MDEKIEKNEDPQLIFVLKENENDKEKIVQMIGYPFNALGGMPAVGDLIKFDTLYRIYLRRFDYSDLKNLKIHFYVIKVIE